MSIYEAVMLLVAIATAVIALLGSNYRGAVWVVAIVIDLMASTLWWVNDLPYGDVFTAACDFTLCLAIYRYSLYRWELWVFRLFMASMLISIIDLARVTWFPSLFDHTTYSSGLELVNYMAFIVIGSVSGFAIANNFSVLAFRPWNRVRALSFLVRSPGSKGP